MGVRMASQMNASCMFIPRLQPDSSFPRMRESMERRQVQFSMDPRVRGDDAVIL
jgi:hypothetical protein